jgi:hypothetical protein
MLSAKKIFFILFIAAAAVLPIFVFAVDDPYGASAVAKKTSLAGMSLSNSSPEMLASQIVNLVLGFTATIFFLMVLYGGITWMTASGQSEKVNKSKEILITAIIGMVIVAASYAISVFIFSRISGTSTCEELGGSCKSSCASDETANFTSTDCGETKYCCTASETATE